MQKGMQGSTAALLLPQLPQAGQHHQYCPFLPATPVPYTTGLGSGTYVVARALFPLLGMENIAAGIGVGQKRSYAVVRLPGL